MHRTFVFLVMACAFAMGCSPTPTPTERRIDHELNKAKDDRDRIRLLREAQERFRKDEPKAVEKPDPRLNVIYRLQPTIQESAT